MKIWILLLCAAVFSSEKRWRKITSKDYREMIDKPLVQKEHPLVKPAKYTVLIGGALCITCIGQWIYCSYMQPNAICQPSTQQNVQALTLWESGKYVVACTACKYIPIEKLYKWAKNITTKEFVKCAEKVNTDFKKCDFESSGECSTKFEKDLENCGSKFEKDTTLVLENTLGKHALKLENLLRNCPSMEEGEYLPILKLGKGEKMSSRTLMLEKELGKCALNALKFEKNLKDIELKFENDFGEYSLMGAKEFGELELKFEKGLGLLKKYTSLTKGKETFAIYRINRISKSFEERKVKLKDAIETKERNAKLKDAIETAKSLNNKLVCRENESQKEIENHEDQQLQAGEESKPTMSWNDHIHYYASYFINVPQIKDSEKTICGSKYGKQRHQCEEQNEEGGKQPKSDQN